jgi:hypothetical protein
VAQLPKTSENKKSDNLLTSAKTILNACFPYFQLIPKPYFLSKNALSGKVCALIWLLSTSKQA